ncbi:hypothetical protein FBY22_3645 [Streptomyces sp. SLBN-31]|nr:hypothetical protein FBY22_3645 [Streptomyces sp. SLBN-31]
MGEEITEGEGVQLIIDTQRDTYEQAIGAVQAACGFNLAPRQTAGPRLPPWNRAPGRRT